MLMKFKKHIKVLLSVVLFISVAGCFNSAPPKDLLKLKPESLQQRQMQSRKYDTLDEEKLLTASASLLQDMGYTLDESETKLGLIVASKDRETDNKGRKALAHVGAVLNIMNGNVNYKDSYKGVEDKQKFRVSVVIHPELKNKSSTVRVTFQRMVWDMRDDLMGLETLNDAYMYQDFFSTLSKSIFIEEHTV